MTVAQLIERLKQLPQDAVVRYWGYHDANEIVTEADEDEPGFVDLGGECQCDGCARRRMEPKQNQTIWKDPMQLPQ